MTSFWRIESTSLLADLRDDPLPCRVSTWFSGSLFFGDDATHMGFIHEGTATLHCSSGVFRLSRGMAFCVPGDGELTGEGAGFVVSRPAFRGLFSLAGPAEREGRLTYIDGCSDTVLIPPPVLGDPCLNLLFVPPRTRQTAHTHPSVRVGLIAEGQGFCVTPARTIPLTAGLVFMIPANDVHSFQTETDFLRVIAWHPDSDTGPSDDNHPMINRTVVS